MSEHRKVALLVGAGDAIGAAVARRFAQGGYTVCVARRDAAKSAALVDELRSQGHDAHARSVDARKEEETQNLFQFVENELGAIEVCLFNAGSNVQKPLLETTEKLFFKAWELACFAGFLVGREAAKHMVPRGAGTMLFTGATAMARELGPKNIHVVHLLIDAGVDSEAIHERMRARGIDPAARGLDTLTKTESIADAYWFAHSQKRDGWTHELDLRPAMEKW
jgi:short chain dehydrogenase